MSFDELIRRLDQLEARLSRIEERLDATAPESDAAASEGESSKKSIVHRLMTPEVPPVAATESSQDPVVAPPTSPAPLPLAPPGEAEAESEPEIESATPGAKSSPPYAVEAPPTVPAVETTVAPRAPKPPKRTIEELIGGKWMAWVGAIVIVIGGGFVVKLGYDAGWWGMISPLGRCVLLAGFSGALLVCGEFVRRRIGDAASVGLYGAGLGVLYLDALAAFRHFDLVSESVALVLMGFVALGGFAITVRTRFRTIGVLSVVGGYLAPVLLSGTGQRDLQLLAYLTVLFAVALGLSAARRQAFRPLRYIAMAGQAILGLGWIVSDSGMHWSMAIVFSSIWWCMIVVESILAATRRQSATGNVVATLLATTAYVTCGCWVLYDMRPPGEPDWLGAFTIAIGALSAIAALQFGPGWDGLRGTLRTAMDKLAVALWAQAGVLLTVAIAMQFEEAGRAIGWMAVAVAAVELGRRLPSRGVSGFAVGLWSLSVLYMLVLGAAVLAGTAPFGMSQVLWETASVEVTGYALLSVLVIALTMIAASRIRLSGLPVVMTTVALMLWFGLCVMCGSRSAALAGWLLAIAALFAAAPLGRRQQYWTIGTTAVIFAAGRWVLFEAISPRFGSPNGAAATMNPLINEPFGLALAIFALAVWVTWHREVSPVETDADEDGDHVEFGAAGAGVLAGLFLLFALSFEVDRAVAARAVTLSDALMTAPLLTLQLFLTALWSVGGALLVLIGRRLRWPFMIQRGWEIALMASLVWLFVDTIWWRMGHAPVGAPVLLNLQFAVGVLAGVVLIVTQRLLPDDETLAQRRQATAGLVTATVFWLGSLEIDRGFAGDAMARQAGFSVYWSLFGVAMVVIGFRIRSAAARYAGLAIIGLTVVKVLLIDLATVDRIWRIVSFIVSGLFMVATSVIYARLSPSLRNGDED